MQENLDKAVEDALTEVDRGYFFPTLRESFLCQAKCCEKSPNRRELQNCIGQCNQRVQSAQASMDSELQSFQNRLQRCAMQCQDEAKDTLPPNASQQQIAKAQDKAVKCVEGCSKEMIGKIPNLKERLKASFT